jgi:hypothetical protein
MLLEKAGNTDSSRVWRAGVWGYLLRLSCTIYE